MHAGAAAFQMGLAGLVVGFSYLHSEALLMVGPWTEIVGEFLTYAISLTLLAAAMSGYLRRDLPGWSRLPLALAGLCLALADAVPVGYRLAAAALLLGGIILAQGRLALPGPATVKSAPSG